MVLQCEVIRNEHESFGCCTEDAMTYHRFSGLQLMCMPLDAQELDPNGLISDKLSMQYAQRRSDEEV